MNSLVFLKRMDLDRFVDIGSEEHITAVIEGTERFAFFKKNITIS